MLADGVSAVSIDGFSAVMVDGVSTTVVVAGVVVWSAVDNNTILAGDAVRAVDVELVQVGMLRSMSPSSSMTPPPPLCWWSGSVVVVSTTADSR